MPTNQNLSAYYPELWAEEALPILRDRLSMGSLVNRELLGGTHNVGDTVNIQTPGSYSAVDLAIGGQVTVQSSTVTNVQVLLDKHKVVPFAIYDAEKAKTTKQLIDIHLKPAMQAMAEKIEDDLIALYANFTGSSVGSYAADLPDTDLPTLRQRFVEANVPRPWNVVLDPKDIAKLITPVANRENIFLKEDMPDSAPVALTESYLGTRLGMRFHEHNRIVTTSGTDTHGLAFGPDTIKAVFAALPGSAAPGSAISIVEDENFSLRIEIARQADYSRDLVKVECLYGIKVVRPTTGFEVKS